MKFLIVLFGFSFLMFLNAQKAGQSDLYKLIQTLKIAKSDTNHINILNNLSESYFRYSKFDSSLLFAYKAISLSKSLNWEKGLAYSNYKIGNVLLIKYQFNEAKIYFENSLKFANKINNSNLVGNNLIGIANVLSGLKEYFYAEKYFTLALNKFKEYNNKKGECLVYQNIALMFQKQGLNDSALSYYQKIIKIAEKNKDQQSISKSYGYMGNIHILKSNFAKALDYFQKALKIDEEIKNKRGLITDNSNLGVFYLNLYTMPEALNYFEEALTLATELGDVQNIGKILLNKGIATEKSSGSYDIKGRESKLLEAKRLYEESLKIAIDLNDKILIGSNYERLGNINFWMNKHHQALLNFENAFNIFEEIGSAFEIASITGKLGVLYFVMAKDSVNTLSKLQRKSFTTKGFELLKCAISQNTKFEYCDQLRTNYSNITNMYFDIGDSLNAFRTESELNKITFKMFQLNKLIEFTKIEKEYELKLQKQNYENELRIEEIKHKNQNRNITIIAIALVLLISILVLYFWKMWKNNIALETKNKIISDANMELDYLNSELSNKNDEIEITNKNLLESNATKDKFFSILAHDLRNPLGSFRQLTEMLHKEYNTFENEERMEFLEILKNSANNLYNLLENLLEWSRSQRGIIPFNPIEFVLFAITKNTIEHLKLTADNKKINIDNNISKSTTLIADINLVTTILRNLLSNAIKFTPEGGNIEIGAINKSSEGIKTSDIYAKNFVQIYVKDSGVGMSVEIKNKLFRIDENVTNKGTSGETGTGLGLILCKEFVEKHNGKIWVESEIGKGSTFWFSLPR